MASTTTLGNNFLLPGRPVLSQAQTPALCSPSLPCTFAAHPAVPVRTLACCPHFCLVSALASPPSVPLPPPSLQANTCTGLQPSTCAISSCPCSPKWDFPAFLPRPPLGLRAQALRTNRSAPYTLCRCKMLNFLQPNCILSQRPERDFNF